MTNCGRCNLYIITVIMESRILEFNKNHQPTLENYFTCQGQIGSNTISQHSGVSI